MMGDATATTGEPLCAYIAAEESHDKGFGKLILEFPLAQSIARLAQGGVY
jgi:hypothetical protein